MKIYGVITKRGVFLDTSKTERGAKSYATQNGYSRIGYRIEYSVTETHYRKGNRWKVVEQP